MGGIRFPGLKPRAGSVRAFSSLRDTGDSARYAIRDGARLPPGDVSEPVLRDVPTDIFPGTGGVD